MAGISRPAQHRPAQHRAVQNRDIKDSPIPTGRRSTRAANVSSLRQNRAKACQPFGDEQSRIVSKLLAGFTAEERANFSRLLSQGYVDTLREFEKGPGQYSWWSRMANCRARNIGWRVDYFVASEKLQPALKGAAILPHILGSDHCPVELVLET